MTLTFDDGVSFSWGDDKQVFVKSDPTDDVSVCCVEKVMFNTVTENLLHMQRRRRLESSNNLSPNGK